MMIVAACLSLCATPFIDFLLTFPLIFPENQEVWSAVVWGVVLNGAIGAAIALVAIPVAALCVKRGWQRLFIVTAFIVMATAIGVSMSRRWKNPPSVMAYFAKTFKAPLPPSAQQIRAHHIVCDERTEFFFVCSATDCSTLIRQLGMVETQPSPGFPREDFPLVLYPLKNAPDYTLWKDCRLFERRDGESGTVDWLVSDGSGTQVFVGRLLGGSKTDAELNDLEP